jgi:NAD(P) transhydrogenase subunit alpha
MKVGVPKEFLQHERRVALIPEAVGKLVGTGLEVAVEGGAGAEAGFSDAAYRQAGAGVVADADALWRASDVVVKVQPPTVDEVGRLHAGAALVSFLQPARDTVVLQALAERQVTAFSMDLIPRITRAQAMDALSSQSNIAGYKAVLLAAASLGKLLPMMMTAAGTIAPAKVFVIGAGVAGLQAIATARRLGAVVSAFDVRPAVKEQVQSLGARFVEVDLVDKETEDAGGYAKELSAESHRREQELLQRTLREMDIVITTALVPGKPAPRLITEAMVRDMKPGSVIIDLAAPAGGNCELTKPAADIVSHGVTICGPLDLAATVPTHASQMYARNVSSFLLALVKNGALNLDFDDEIVAATCVTHGGNVRMKA